MVEMAEMVEIPAPRKFKFENKKQNKKNISDRKFYHVYNFYHGASIRKGDEGCLTK